MIERRIRMDLWHSTERAIYDVLQMIEKMPADTRLTTAQTKLSEAKNLVSDFVDDGLTKDQIKIGSTYRHLNGSLVFVLGKNNGYIPIECKFIQSGSYFSCVPGYLIEEVQPLEVKKEEKMLREAFLAGREMADTGKKGPKRLMYEDFEDWFNKNLNYGEQRK